MRYRDVLRKYGSDLKQAPTWELLAGVATVVGAWFTVPWWAFTVIIAAVLILVPIGMFKRREEKRSAREAELENKIDLMLKDVKSLREKISSAVVQIDTFGNPVETVVNKTVIRDWEKDLTSLEGKFGQESSNAP